MSDETFEQEPREFTGENLRGARFARCDLSGAEMREVDLSGLVLRAGELAGADLDAPWLIEGGGSLLINGVDVVPLVDAELNRRFPGRELRRAGTPDGLREAWAALESSWAATLDRVARLAPEAVDVSIGQEWSFAQTLRHLVMATDTWLGRAILRREEPYHPIGMPNIEYALDGNDPSVFSAEQPTYAEVLIVRADRVAQVRAFIADATPELLAEARANPWAPQYPETVLSCLHTILEEEWEHHRYAVRDLDALDAGQGERD